VGRDRQGSVMARQRNATRTKCKAAARRCVEVAIARCIVGQRGYESYSSRESITPDMWVTAHASSAFRGSRRVSPASVNS
jgi:hypothetical protein